MTPVPRFLPEADLRILLVRAQGGDRAALARVVEQVRPFIHKLALQYSRRPGGAPVEDLIQTGLLAAIKSVPCFDTSAQVKFVTYVGVAAQRAIHRAAFGWKSLPQAAGADVDFLGEVPDRWDADAPRHATETATEVRRLIAAHLGARERALVRQRFGLDGTPPRTYAELAVVTGTSRQNVQQLVERALRRLRTALDSNVLKA